MKQISSVIFWVAITFIACQAPTEAVDNASEAQSVALDTYFAALTKLKKFNGGVLVQKAGKVILHEVYNMEEDEQSSLHMSKESQFDIHSISKLMAQACIVKLEEEKLINRADKVSKFIPDFPKGDLITIQQLMDNQAGLPRGFSKAHEQLIDKSPAEIVAYIKEEPLLYAPGSEVLYSNLGYQLLYFIIAGVVQKPFVQYLEDEFLRDLQMNDTGAHFHLVKNNLDHPVKNHENDDGEMTVVPNFNQEDKNQARLYSTLADLLIFVDYLKNEPYLSAMKNEAGDLGWSGGGDGILSHAKASINSNYEFVFFSNYDEIPFGDILETVEKIMTNQPYELPVAINRQAVELDRGTMEKYLGKYNVKEFNNDTFEFRIENDSFIFYQNGAGRTPLQAESDSTFFYQSDSEDYFLFRNTQREDIQLIYNYKKLEIPGIKVAGEK